MARTPEATTCLGGSPRGAALDLSENCMPRARWTTAARIGLLATTAVVAATAGLLPTTGRANQKASPVRAAESDKPESRVLQAEDGFNVHISYYRSTGDKESPVVVLVHEEAGNRCTR